MKILGLLMLLAACAPEAPKPAPKVKAAAPANIYPVYGIAVAPGGLLLTDPKTNEAKPAGFGMRQSLIIAILARTLGPATEGRDDGCGKDFARWGTADVLTLWFAEGAFAGWTLAGAPRAISVSPGMLRKPAMTAGAICSS